MNVHFIRPRCLLSSCAALGLLAGIANLASAQEELPELVVTATRVPIPPEQSGSAITVISSEQLEQRQIRTVADALRDVPGATVSRSGGPGTLTEIYLRGAETNQTLVLIDGVEVNNPDGGAFDFNSLLDLAVERVEVLRGPQSVLWGSAAIGGVINIVTKSAERPLQASARLEGGSFNTWQSSGSVGGRGDRYDALLSGAWLKTDGWSAGSAWRGNSEDDGARIGSLLFKGSVRPRDDLELTLIERYTDSRSDFDAFIGGDQKPVVDSQDRGENRQNALRLQGKFSLLDGAWEHLLGIARYDIDSTAADTGLGAFDSDSHSNQIDYQSNYFLTTGGAKHTFTALIKDKEDEARNTYFAGNAIRNTGVAFHYGLGLDERLFLTAGVRRDFNDRFDDTSTYRLTAAYLWPDLGGRLHASYGTAVKNPTLTELFGFSGDFQGNPGLQPEESRGFDIGWEQSLLDQRLKFDVTAFDNRIDNIIVGAGRTVINLPGESRARGVELSASADLTPDLSGTLAYTFTDTEDTDGQELRRRPRHAASLGLNYRVNDRANLNLTVRHNGSFSDTAFDPETFVTYPVKLDGYTLVNLAASYQWDGHWQFFGRVENLLDERYEDILGYSGAERGVYVGARYRF
ncbi:MAG TPA: TonB-dependent receptor [Candidatus Competibacter sp.]|nr:TonB-dependent receptor [Candidatus Competibacteraceae bacterium]HRC72204.1 TonB-dependent receptor [Candidatus Competibacter sp.]